MKPSIYIIIPMLIFLFACGGKKQTSSNHSTDTTTVKTPEDNPDEKKMDHYTSGYQNWIEDNDMKETLGYAEVWYDGKFIIVSDSSRKTNPKFTLKIGNRTEVDSTMLPKDGGGMNTRTKYELEPNDEGFNKLIVFTNEYELRIFGNYKYIIAFTLTGKKNKAYYCNKDK